ncbi:hypothetical protein [Bacillus seohaeanensis]|uniref:DUF5067 domain-containing protein n=1 Tax=Bacillus seohaeanensis TaxID=284580 RepID=A0ABW5RTT5_9BACI
MKKDFGILLGTFALVIIGVLIMVSQPFENDEPEKVTTANTEPVSEPPAKQQPEVKEYNATWSDDYKGYISEINKVEIENKTLRVYFKFTNNSPHQYSNMVEWGKAVVNKKQIDANFIGSEDVGGEHLNDTEREGFVEYYADSLEDLEELTEVRITWHMLNDDQFEKKEYDVTLPLK